MIIFLGNLILYFLYGKATIYDDMNSGYHETREERMIGQDVFPEEVLIC
jgi:hypothetical protein